MASLLWRMSIRRSANRENVQPLDFTSSQGPRHRGYSHRYRRACHFGQRSLPPLTFTPSERCRTARTPVWQITHVRASSLLYHPAFLYEPVSEVPCGVFLPSNMVPTGPRVPDIIWGLEYARGGYPESPTCIGDRVFWVWSFLGESRPAKVCLVIQ